MRVSSDDRAVVCHDAGLARLTGRVGLVALTSSHRLGRLSLLGTDQHVPLLSEVLELVAGQVPLLLELKPHEPPARLERAVISALRGYRGPVAVQSFDPFSLRAMRELDPRIPRGQIGGPLRNGDLKLVERLALQHLAGSFWSAPSFVAYEFAGLPALSTRVARRVGLPVLVWTVRSPAEEAFARRYADNVIFEGYLPRRT